MKNPFENIFGGSDTPKKEPIEYTGKEKHTADETGAVVRKEIANTDKQFKEERE